jgi:hypothetical protein
MFSRLRLASVVLLLFVAAALAQAPAERPRTSRANLPQDTSRYAGPSRGPAAVIPVSGGGLSATDGQTWATYDISPYTRRVTSTSNPEQAIVDWVLRETGYERWHSEPMGVLCANRRVLKVYHTAETQAIVKEIVDRFVSGEAESHEFGLRVITLADPNWRARAIRVLHPVEVESQGVQAWLMEREEARLLLAELQKRSDFREHGSPQLLVNNGQSYVLSLTRPKNYVRDLILRPGTLNGFEAVGGTIEEGFALEFSPLLSLDGALIDAVIKCHIDQVERLRPVTIETPTPTSPRQRARIEVPQMSQCRFQERFRWPVDQVLLLGLGVVPTPVPADTTPLHIGLGPPPPGRADLLVFVESKGRRAQAPVVRNAARETNEYRDRY